MKGDEEFNNEDQEMAILKPFQQYMSHNATTASNTTNLDHDFVISWSRNDNEFMLDVDMDNISNS